MKKALSITFILGAITGSTLTFFLTNESSTQFLPGEVKVLTKTEYRNSPNETINGEVLEIPGETPEPIDDFQDMETPESVGYEIPDEGVEAVPTQMDKFERSIASELETPTIVEELPTSAPEEAPPEAPPEEPNEDEPK